MNNRVNEEKATTNNSKDKQMHTIPSAYHIDTEIYHEPETDNSDNGEDPIITRHDEVLEERDRIEKDKQSSRITRHWRETFRQQQEHFTERKIVLVYNPITGGKDTLFHRQGWNSVSLYNRYLREGCSLSIAILPRENRYLYELRKECIFYKLKGLQRLVETRLKMYQNLGLAY